MSRRHPDTTDDRPASQEAMSAEAGPDDIELPPAPRTWKAPVWLSAVRCILLYVLVPLAPAAFGWIGPLNLVLHVAAAASATWATLVFFRTRHPLKWFYAAFAAIVVLLAVVDLVRHLSVG